MCIMMHRDTAKCRSQRKLKYKVWMVNTDIQDPLQFSTVFS